MYLRYSSHEILTPLSENSLYLIEEAGRTCYKSESKMTRDSMKKFINMIVSNGHHSVLEHVSVSVRLICDRGITHELVRHRLGSYSQESSRYVSYKTECQFIIPNFCPSIREGIYGYDDLESFRSNMKEYLWMKNCLDTEVAYKDMITVKCSPQEARCVLNNSTKTEIIVTTNLREWRHIFDLRSSSKAHPQFQQLIIPVLVDFHKHVPVVFDDIIEKYKDYISKDNDIIIHQL